MSADSPVLVCYDGSDSAREAVARAASLLSGRRATVLSVWQPVASLPSFAWGGGGLAGIDFTDLDRQAEEAARKLAEEGAQLAQDAGLDASAATARAAGPVWQAIVTASEEHDAAVVVLGARGLTGVKHALLGSVSEGVTRHGSRPALVVHGAAA